MTELLRLLAIGLLFWLAQSDTNCPLTITLKGIQSSMLDSIMQISQSQYIVERAKVGHTIQFDSTPNSHVVQDSSANGTINIMSPTLRPTSFIAAEFPNDLTNETSLNLITFPFAAK